ncbi:hypothetical protein L6164_011254 [Bauhinia variegata]|uniref:Uncharacterized protein n=1 Tax=Bauhinia variegata TaxID=167791 RepID=A0ACB9P5I7_BAUVA|nr:hypothetical protein L6164_011254 [Bauhinia variegata]
MIFSLWSESEESFCSKIQALSLIPMEETNQKMNANQKNLTMQASGAPINFLQRFFAGKPDKAKSSTNSEEVDLSLNLSLGGPYGQNGGEKTLTRSSSIAGDTTQSTVTNGSLGGGYSGVRLEKSCSLPAKADMVLMRFGDLQTMRRAETGRRLLLEKQMRAAKAAKAAETEKAPAVHPPPAVVEGQHLSHGAASWAPASAYNIPGLNGAMDKVKFAHPKHEEEWSEVEGFLIKSFQSGCQTNLINKGLSGLAESGESSNVQTPTNQVFKVPAISAAKEKLARPAGTTSENASKRVKFFHPSSAAQGDSSENLRQMPTVSTTGDGPNGKRIEGVLYKYLKGDVWIVCVCHGHFFTPAGFVKHAGAKNVENPMRRISVHVGNF